MERFTMSLEDSLARQFDDFIRAKGYSNRSEAMRDLIREKLEAERLANTGNGYCVGTLSYVYNHHESELAARITSAQHDHHELTLSTMHVHLDHDNCLEITALRGAITAVRDFANKVMAARGVRHGNLHMVPVQMTETAHGTSGAMHVHSHPQT